jgi:hypothetical protein
VQIVVPRHDGSYIALYQTTLDVTSLGGLTSGINQTFATTHGVKEELLGLNRVRILQIHARFRSNINFTKVGSVRF